MRNDGRARSVSRFRRTCDRWRRPASIRPARPLRSSSPARRQTAGSIEERGATVRASAKDISAKAIAYAEKNVQSSLDYAQSLLHAKDLTEVMRLHSEYVQAQMRVAGGAGERNGSDRQPGGHGRGKTKGLEASRSDLLRNECRSAAKHARREAVLQSYWSSDVDCSVPHSDYRVSHAALHLKFLCVAQK